ncbi:Zn-finger containing NTP pyrophosphohydrolase [Opitutaceae bacterium TAV1]|nr:Zn-finger containing NTP pyrophosphohydrolase [Opitutaceae bacterium TAV1]
MNPENPQRILRQITDEKFVNLFAIETPTPTGKRSWLFASRKKAEHAGTVTADAVVIVAIVAREGTPRLLVTREYRAPLGRHELSLPSGLVDPGETIETAAARELFEETGLCLKRILHVSPPVASSAGLTDEAVCLVYAEAEGMLSCDHQTEHEDIESQLLSLGDLRRLLRNPGTDVISSRLYPMLMGFIAAGSFQLPDLHEEHSPELTTLYRPVGPEELELIKQSGYREFPPRLPEQPIFYPVLNEDYATQIARDWNVRSSGAGFVTRFSLPTAFLKKYPTQIVGSRVHAELWVPAEELPEFNRHIVGLIEVVARFP